MREIKIKWEGVTFKVSSSRDDSGQILSGLFRRRSRFQMLIIIK